MAAIKESKTQGDDVEKGVAFDEGAAKESVDELIEKLTLKKPKEFAFLKAEEIPPKEHLDDVQKGRLAETPSADVPPTEPSADPPPVQSTSSTEQGPPPEETAPEEPSESTPEGQPGPPLDQRSFSGLRTTLLLLLFFISLGLYAYFVYPTMYENRTTKSGDMTYPVRINRLTKSMQYYHMGEWHSGPILKTTTYRAHVTIPSKNDLIPAEKETLNTAEETRVTVPETAPIPSVESSTDEKTEEKNIATPEKEVEKEEDVVVNGTLPLGEKTVKPVQEYFYTIQISSMRFKEFAEEFLKELERKGIGAHMRVIETEKHGLWYVIYIGHFASRKDAVAYMKEKNIPDSYPDSYIRKVSNR